MSRRIPLCRRRARPLRRAARLLGLALPLAAVLFVLFPRFGPLWALPTDAKARSRFEAVQAAYEILTRSSAAR